MSHVLDNMSFWNINCLLTQCCQVLLPRLQQKHSGRSLALLKFTGLFCFFFPKEFQVALRATWKIVMLITYAKCGLTPFCCSKPLSYTSEMFWYSLALILFYSPSLQTPLGDLQNQFELPGTEVRRAIWLNMSKCSLHIRASSETVPSGPPEDNSEYSEYNIQTYSGIPSQPNLQIVWHPC